MACTIGIEPRMELQPALVCFRDGEFQRVIKWIRRSSHSAGEILGPRLVSGCVKCIRCRPHLEDYRIESEREGAIEHADQLVFLLLCRQPGLRWPVDVLDRRNPNAPELAPSRRRRRKHLPRCRLRLPARGVKTGEHEK